MTHAARSPRPLLLGAGALAAVLLAVVLAGVRRPGAVPGRATAGPVTPRAAATAPRPIAARDTLEQVVRTLGLNAGLRSGCYTIEVDPSAAPVTADVREVHDARCGGDPNTAPRITSLQWDPATGAVVTDFWGLPKGRLDTIPAAHRVPPTAPAP